MTRVLSPIPPTAPADCDGCGQTPCRCDVCPDCDQPHNNGVRCVTCEWHYEAGRLYGPED